MSNAQVAKLARLAAGRPAETLSSSSGNGNGGGSSGPELVMDDFRHTADQAYGAVDVPDSVIDILAELRCYLQDKCEPPIYVSDRRFMKAVQMLQVSTQVNIVLGVAAYWQHRFSLCQAVVLENMCQGTTGAANATTVCADTWAMKDCNGSSSSNDPDPTMAVLISCRNRLLHMQMAVSL